MSLDVPQDQHPIDLLNAWLSEAKAAGARRTTAMALATASLDGLPSVRMVIARQIDRDGILFYTDARSAKSRDLAANPRAAVTFYWSEVSRAVRVSGRVETLPAAKAAAFFAGYAAGVQRAMRVSTQSASLTDRRDLERDLAADSVANPDQGPVAPGFTGYRIMPAEIEFWAEAPDALHDRILFKRLDTGWVASRLQP